MAKKRSTQLMIGVLGGSAAVLILALVVSRQLSRPRPAPAPAAEPAGAEAPPTELRCTALHYGAALKSDAEAYHVTAPTLEEMPAPLRGGNELAAPRTLKGKGGTLETAHLRLQTSIAKLHATFDGTQGIRADHVVLSITNTSAVPVAYRVLTELPNAGKCASKADLPHNAIVLLPHETVRRTECLAYARPALTVSRVDVYEVTALGHRYLSRLEPSEGAPFDMRVARAHVGGGVAACRAMPWRDLEEQDDVWRSVIDFHARHNCDEYTQPRSYRPWTAAGKLPVCGP